jgi:hypothetical protein
MAAASSLARRLACLLAKAHAYEDSEGKAALWALLLAPFCSFSSVWSLHRSTYLVRDDFSAFCCEQGIVVHSKDATREMVYLLVPTTKGACSALLDRFASSVRTEGARVVFCVSPLCSSMLGEAACEAYCVMTPRDRRIARSLDELRGESFVTSDATHVRLPSGALLPLVGTLRDPRDIASYTSLARSLIHDGVALAGGSVEQEDACWIKVRNADYVALVHNDVCTDTIDLMTRVCDIGDEDCAPDGECVLEQLQSSPMRALQWTFRLLDDKFLHRGADQYLCVIECEYVPKQYRRILTRMHFKQIGVSDGLLKAVSRGGFAVGDADMLISTLCNVWAFLTQPRMYVRDFRRFLTRVRTNSASPWCDWLVSSDQVYGIIYMTDVDTIVHCCNTWPEIRTRIHTSIEEDGVCSTAQHACVTRALISAGLASDALLQKWARCQDRYDTIVVPKHVFAQRPPTRARGIDRDGPKEKEGRQGVVALETMVAFGEEEEPNELVPTEEECSYEDRHASKSKRALCAIAEALRAKDGRFVDVHLIGSCHFYDAHDLDVVVEVAVTPSSSSADDASFREAVDVVVRATGWETVHDRHPCYGAEGGGEGSAGALLLRGRCELTGMTIDAQVVRSQTLRTVRADDGSNRSSSVRRCRRHGTQGGQGGTTVSVDARAAWAVRDTQTLVRRLSPSQRRRVAALHQWMDAAQCKGAILGRLAGIAVTLCATDQLRRDPELTLWSMLRRLTDALDVAVPRIAMDEDDASDGARHDAAGRHQRGCGPEAPLAVVALDDETVVTSRMTIGTTRMLHNVLKWTMTTAAHERIPPMDASFYKKQLRENTICVLLLRPRRADAASRTAHTMLARMEQHRLVSSIGLYACDADKREAASTTATEQEDGACVYEVRVTVRSLCPEDALRYAFGSADVVVARVDPLLSNTSDGTASSYALVQCRVGTRDRQMVAVAPRFVSRFRQLHEATRVETGSYLHLPDRFGAWCVPNAPSLTTDLALQVPAAFWEVVGMERS